jgi:hypothetical protein
MEALKASLGMSKDAGKPALALAEAAADHAVDDVAKKKSSRRKGA